MNGLFFLCMIAAWVLVMALGFYFVLLAMIAVLVKLWKGGKKNNEK